MSVLDTMTTREVAALSRAAIVAVPLGACEQHGPHLPLRTDSLVAAWLCDSLAASRDDVVVAPLLGVGASGEHDGFAGTLSIGTEVLAAVCVELVRSARRWARGVVFVSGHGGNADALGAVERVCAHEGDAVVTWLARALDGDAHAGRTETSIVLALDGTCVRHNEVVQGVTTPLSVLAPALRRDGVASVSASGVLGDPTKASAGEGVRVLAALARDLRSAVDAAFGARP